MPLLWRELSRLLLSSVPPLPWSTSLMMMVSNFQTLNHIIIFFTHTHTVPDVQAPDVRVSESDGTAEICIKLGNQIENPFFLQYITTVQSANGMSNHSCTLPLKFHVNCSFVLFPMYSLSCNNRIPTMLCMYNTTHWPLLPTVNNIVLITILCVMQKSRISLEEVPQYSSTMESLRPVSRSSSLMIQIPSLQRHSQSTSLSLSLPTCQATYHQSAPW